VKAHTHHHLGNHRALARFVGACCAMVAELVAVVAHGMRRFWCRGRSQARSRDRLHVARAWLTELVMGGTR
jgi:hypothetical protein